jgi:hypothetical protein
MALEVTNGPTRSECERTAEPGIWACANDVLYRLCEKYPFHDSSEEIVAKVWLIGRSYAAAVERGRVAGANSEKFYTDTVAPAFRDSDLDHRLAQVQRGRTIGDGDVQEVLEIHANLAKTVHKISGRIGRSFASKYLHFHRPLYFPIFDSRAAEGVRKCVVGRAESSFPEGDGEYRSFLARYLTLRRWIEDEHGLRLTPRQIDRLLLEY